ncbi:hypothetical protein Pst134EA_013505 [Puccinia striiformis f. sp. tritici]|uniref:hypothetical protein n=1 Tax=Puccinia striiformis f. sp. tritici TaxID=168172 RepID=UPI002007706F|nr:hypothetical protein Pst134EA_013505 [Puccinia striiformis f. sp. tritici]KAH9465623.1 hypothetical protein Pst134EA_013505 [Puccinia striiformis f. sp. tritici]
MSTVQGLLVALLSTKNRVTIVSLDFDSEMEDATDRRFSIPIVEDHRVCSRQVGTQATSSCGQKEDENSRTIVPIHHHISSLSECGASIES